MIEPAIADDILVEQACGAGCGNTALVVAGVVVLVKMATVVVDLCALTLIEVGLLADGVCDGCRITAAKHKDTDACMNRVS